MAFQPAPACAQAVLRFGLTTGGTFTHANVLNYVSDGATAWTAGQLETLGEALAAWFDAIAKVNMSAVYSLINIELRGLESQEAAYADWPVGIAGSAAGDPLPPNVAACITMTTPFTGRSARGRMYWGGLAESQSGGASLNAGNVTGINDMAEALLNDVNNDSPGQLVVLSRYSNGVARVNASPFVVTSMALRDGVLDTQRRRINRLKV